jgi:hypothetical protein
MMVPGIGFKPALTMRAEALLSFVHWPSSVLQDGRPVNRIQADSAASLLAEEKTGRKIQEEKSGRKIRKKTNYYLNCS